MRDDISAVSFLPIQSRSGTGVPIPAGWDQPEWHSILRAALKAASLAFSVTLYRVSYRTGVPR